MKFCFHLFLSLEEALITEFLKTSEALISVDKDELNFVYSTFKRDDASSEATVKSFEEILKNQLQRSKESGRTQKLWIRFIEMVELVQTFIRAEKSRDFLLYLHCIHQMLPIFHASGHLNYSKLAYVYHSLERLDSMNQDGLIPRLTIFR